MHSTVAFVAILMVVLSEQGLVAPLCPCAQFPPNFCSCQAGPSPICSCRAILPSPSCACAVQAHITQCRTSCQQICQSTCSQSRLFLTCPSFCGNTCVRSCMPQPALPMPVPVAVPRVILPVQCPRICQQTCQKVCAVRPFATCIPQCQQSCAQKCVTMFPIQKQVQLVAAQPNPALLVPAPAVPVVPGPAVPMVPAPAVPVQGCTDCTQKQHVQREAMSFPDITPVEGAQPLCPEACMPNCDPECIMQHQLLADPQFQSASPVPALDQTNLASPLEEPILSNQPMDLPAPEMKKKKNAA